MLEFEELTPFPRNGLIMYAVKIVSCLQGLEKCLFFNFSDVAAGPEGAKSFMAPNTARKSF